MSGAERVCSFSNSGPWDFTFDRLPHLPSILTPSLQLKTNISPLPVGMGLGLGLGLGSARVP